MTASKTVEKPVDLEAIVTTPGVIEVDGIPARVRRLKSKEFLGLIRVLTLGLGPNIQHVKLEGDKDEVTGQVIAMFMMAIPEAVEEFGQFMFKIVEPVDPKQAVQLARAMDNPEIDTLLDLITTVAEQEAPDFASLVGKAKAALTRIQSVYRPTGK
jgi:hypothetical protein